MQSVRGRAKEEERLTRTFRQVNIAIRCIRLPGIISAFGQAPRCWFVSPVAYLLAHVCFSNAQQQLRALS